MPRKVPIAASGPSAGFHGLIKISDFDSSPKHARFRGDYVCNGCGVKGVFILTLQKELWPKGFTQKDVEEGMQYKIRVNHKCRVRVELTGLPKYHA